MDKKIKEFLKQSNYIEKEYSEVALEDAKKAWNYAYRNRNKITISYVLEIHRLLMKRLRPDIAGKFRDCDVFIGGYRKYFTSEYLIKMDLYKKVLFKMASKRVFKNPEERAKQIHIAFEGIHPFLDSNGRCGRLLWQIHRINMGLPVKIIHEGDEQQLYYSWFSNN